MKNQSERYMLYAAKHRPQDYEYAPMTTMEAVVEIDRIIRKLPRYLNERKFHSLQDQLTRLLRLLHKLKETSFYHAVCRVHARITDDAPICRNDARSLLAGLSRDWSLVLRNTDTRWIPSDGAVHA